MGGVYEQDDIDAVTGVVTAVAEESGTFFPLPEEDEKNGGRCISERYKRILWQAGAEKAGDVRLILIPMTRFLRMAKKGVPPSIAVAELGFINEMKTFFEGRTLAET